MRNMPDDLIRTINKGLAERLALVISKMKNGAVE